MTSAAKAYDASSIVILEGLEAVRKRPGMYIGDVGSPDGLHHMLWEIVDNGVDEALAGHAKIISVGLHADGSVSVTDDGRGMPVDLHPKEKRSAAEVIMTVLHAGGKFDQNSYKVSGGLHGVGASVVNALSAWVKLIIFRDGGEHHVEFRRGATVAPLKRIQKAPKDKTGTTVHFLPDPDVFTHTEFDREAVIRGLRDKAFLNSGIRLQLRDERQDPAVEETFYYEGGIADMVRHLDRTRQPLIGAPIHILSQKDGIIVEVGLEWTDSYHENLLAFTNNIPQKDHGTHVAGFRAALTRVFTAYIEQENIKRGKALEPEDIREGITAVVSIKLPDPKFSSQTKEKLVSSEATAAVQQATAEGLKTWFEEHPAEARKIIEKAAAAASAREASRRARDMSRKSSGNEVASLPGKLADCQSKKAEDCELFLVEGDSAGGSAKQGRDRKHQAILPLRGKILNVERARLDEVLGSQEVGTLIKALGTGIGEDFNADKCRYHKIVIMTDADVDGAHIRTLLLTFFFRQMPELIHRGYVWIAQPPLYKLKYGRKERFLADQDALERAIANLGCDGLTIGGLSGEALANAVLAFRGAFKPMTTLAQRFGSADLIDALATSGVIAATVGGHGLDRFAAGTERLLNKGFDVKKDGKWSLHLTDDEIIAAFDLEGVVETTRIRVADLQNSEGRAIARVQDKIEALLGGDPALATTGSRILGPLSLWTMIENRGRKGAEIQRFKGLGEMNPEELWSTTLDNTVRRLLRVDVADAERADELFSTLMGDAVEARRAFIEERGMDAALDL